MAKKNPPDYSTRIQPGERRNPHGRPRKAPKSVSESAYDVLHDRRVTVTLGGVERELSAKEGLEQRMLQAAFDGSRMAIRTVLKWIKKREEAKPSRACRLPIIKMEYPATATADEALLILGIASEVPNAKREDGGPFLQLQPWAVAQALARPFRKRPSAQAYAEMQRRTQDADTMPWPRGLRDER